MKNLQNLKGAKALSKEEQQVINGGGSGCGSSYFDGYEECLSNCANDMDCQIVIPIANECYICVPSQEQ